MFKKTAILTVITGSLLASAHGAVLAQYQFTSGSLVSSDAEANSTASTLTAGFSFTAASDLLQVYGDQGTANNTNLAGAITAAAYLSVTLAPDAGYTASFSSLTFTHGVSNVNYGNANFQIYVLADLDHDGFDSTNDTLGSSTFGPTGDTSANRNILLSGFTGLQNLSAGTEIRFYFVDNSGVNTRFHTLDNVVFNGTTLSVPEPATTALLGLAASGLLLRRRHARSSPY